MIRSQKAVRPNSPASPPQTWGGEAGVGVRHHVIWLRIMAAATAALHRDEPGGEKTRNTWL